MRHTVGNETPLDAAELHVMILRGDETGDLFMNLPADVLDIVRKALATHRTMLWTMLDQYEVKGSAQTVMRRNSAGLYAAQVLIELELSQRQQLARDRRAE